MGLMGGVDRKAREKIVCNIFGVCPYFCVHLIGERIRAGASRELMFCLFLKAV